MASRTHLGAAALAAILMTGVQAGDLRAQQGQPDGSPRASAPIDLTGTWVSVVTEEWRWRMVTPPRGDFSSIPLNDEGQRVGEAWDPEADAANGEACRAYGAAGIMRMPTRARISWADDDTLRLETDAGQQLRLFEFGDAMEAPGEPSWQGNSHAAWNRSQNVDVSQNPQPGGGSMTVTTTNMRPGYLFRNGAPYSGDAVLTEYFHRHDDTPTGDQWFTVVVVLSDPTYLAERYVTSYHFKREADDSGWNPTPCMAG